MGKIFWLVSLGVRNQGGTVRIRIRIRIRIKYLSRDRVEEVTSSTRITPIACNFVYQ